MALAVNENVRRDRRIPRRGSPSNAQVKELHAAMDAIETPLDGQLVISSQDVLLTCAYYVGSWCAEWEGDYCGWCLQPYSRDTEYMGSFEEAKRMLDHWLTGEEEVWEQENSRYCVLCDLHYDIEDPCPYH